MLDAFLADIIAHPDDDVPRLVLADWLEDHGGPDGPACAAFIRAQCRLARLPPDHPDRDDLEAAVLLHERRPAQRLAVRVRRLARRWRFHRGMVEEVGLTAGPLLACGEELFRAAPVRRLSLSGGGEDMAALAGQPWLGRVRGLRLVSWGPERLLLSGHLDALRELTVEGHAVDGRDLATAAWSKRLELLGVGVPAGQLAGWARHLEPGRLRVLRLLYQPSRGLARDAEALARLLGPLLPGLEQLELDGWGVGQVVGALSAAPAPRLWGLALRRSWASEAEFRQLLELPLTRQLHLLDLDWTNLTDQSLSALARCPSLASLAELRLWAEVRSLPQLTEVVRSPHLAGLRRLAIRGLSSPASQRQKAAFLEQVHLPRLGAFSLAGPPVYDTVMHGLLRAPWLTQVYHLRLGLLAGSAREALAAHGPWPRLARLELERFRQDFSGLRQRFGERLRY